MPNRQYHPDKSHFKTFDSVDELLDQYNGYKSMGPNLNVYNVILSNCSETLLFILKSETNKPSIHDLYLISSILNTHYNKLPLIFFEILEVYKNRKELT